MIIITIFISAMIKDKTKYNFSFLQCFNFFKNNSIYTGQITLIIK